MTKFGAADDAMDFIDFRKVETAHKMHFSFVYFNLNANGQKLVRTLSSSGVCTTNLFKVVINSVLQ